MVWRLINEVGSNSKIKNSVLEAVGCSPLIRLNRLSADINADILVKMEFVNPSGSLKDGW